MKYSIDDYIGKKINYVEVLGLDENNKSTNSCHWLFKCCCGNVFSDIPCNVIGGHKKSCGCMREKRFYVHGLNSNPFYHTWWSMHQRCYNPEHHNYPRYGARGIKVCEEWHDLLTFIKWCESTIGEKNPEYTIDRKDNNADYCPENCRWATRKEQSRNRRITVKLCVNGETKPLTEWAEIYNIPESTIRQRIKMGWDEEKAVTTLCAKKKKFAPDEKGIALYEINGEKKNITEWCKIYGIRRDTVYSRLSNGLDIVTALTKPVRKSSFHRNT